MHIDAASKEEMEAVALPNVKNQINATVWLGDRDAEPVASVMDFQKPGFAWLSFSKGTSPELNNRFRQNVMRQIAIKWPNTTALPVMPNGGIPLPRDLTLTNQGYMVDEDAAHKYRIGN